MNTSLKKGTLTSLGTYLLALVATLVFFKVSMWIPVVLEQLRYTDIWSLVYNSHRRKASIVLITVLGFYLYTIKKKDSQKALFGSILYFLPTFSVFLVGMALTFTGIEIIANTVYQTLFDMGIDSNLFFDRLLSRTYYVGEFFFIPYWLYVILFWSGEDWYAIFPLRDEFGAFFILLGSLVMFLGVSKWIEGKIMNIGLVRTGIYRVIRHPQYLGFILWGYGVMVFSTHRQAPFQHPIVPTLNWVLSSLMIAGVALVEEMELRQSIEEYNKYSENTAFLIPMPRFIRRTLARPWKKLWNGDFPSTLRMIGVTLAIIYSLILLPGLLYGNIYRYENLIELGKTIDFYEIYSELGF